MKVLPEARDPRPGLDRLSPDDLMSLVGDRDAGRPQVGAVLVLAGRSVDAGAVRSALEQRLPAVSRLRQILVPVPLGSGRPVWMDDPSFKIQEHFTIREAPEPVSHQELLDLAANLISIPLPGGQPLWKATFVPGVDSGRAALIFVFHHVLADGEAGLGLLRELLVAAQAPEDPAFPRPAPARKELLIDAALSRIRSVRRLPAALVRLAAAAVELSPTLLRAAPACSLNQPTGPSRRFRTVSTNVAELVALAHRAGATVNDVLLTVIAGALTDLLADRDERLPYIVASVPFSMRPGRGVHDLGNHSGVIAVRLPVHGSFAVRLAGTARQTRRAKEHVRGASTALLAPVFRLADRLGLYHHFINHQKLIHTFVSNVRGPAESLDLASNPLVELIPLSMTSGNVTVAFTALSYGGHCVITINADPVTCPDLDRLADMLTDQLSALGLPVAADATNLTVAPPP